MKVLELGRYLIVVSSVGYLGAVTLNEGKL